MDEPKKKVIDKNNKQEWFDLYEYVKREIFGYEDEKLSKYCVLRLIGLSEGKFMANKKQVPLASYSFTTILYTFKICKPQILSALKSVAFKDERHKINYIMVIVEGEINSVIDRLNRKKIATEKAESLDTSYHQTEAAEYKPKTKKVNKKLEDLW